MLNGLPGREKAPLPAGCNPACPGCAHRDLSAAESAVRKGDFLAERLAPWAERLAPLVAIGDAQRLGYRDRAILSAHWDGRRWQLGMMRRDEVVPIHDCPVHTPRLRATVCLLAARLPGYAAFPLHFLVQSGAQCTLVLKTATLPPMGWLDGALQAELAAIGLEGLWLHLHPAAGRKIFHKRGWSLVWGRPRSRDAEGQWHGPAAFQQLIPELYQASRAEAEAFLAPRTGDRVVDLYCGAGGTLRRWLAAGAEAVGVELGGEAVECAQLNAPGAEVLRGCCEARLPQLDRWLVLPAGRRLVYANPPRTGLEPPLRDWLAERCRPARIAYLSCSAGTLGRDLAVLEAGGYRVERISPYDFFPQTLHVEALALLERG